MEEIHCYLDPEIMNIVPLEAAVEFHFEPRKSNVRCHYLEDPLTFRLKQIKIALSTFISLAVIFVIGFAFYARK
jgi:hypothetical protein